MNKQVIEALILEGIAEINQFKIGSIYPDEYENENVTTANKGDFPLVYAPT